METAVKFSSLALIPDFSAWPALQALRVAHDRQVDVWPPHINILYPFVPEARMEAAAKKLAEVTAEMKPIRLRFSRFINFGSTLCLEPECEDGGALAALRSACDIAFPELRDFQHSTFQPHLTIGQFKNARACQAFIADHGCIQVDAEVSCVSLLARDTMKSPFRTPFRVRLGVLDNGLDRAVESGGAVQYTRDEHLRSLRAHVTSRAVELVRMASGGVKRTSPASGKEQKAESSSDSSTNLQMCPVCESSGLLFHDICPVCAAGNELHPWQLSC